MSTNYQVIEGSPGLNLGEVAHVLLPGCGRSSNGRELSRPAWERTLYAAELFVNQELEVEGGVIVPSGYKSPADKAGQPWSPARSQEVFIGIPEAHLSGYYLALCGINPEAIKIEPHSIDTVTNFVLSENTNKFPDDRPVAIVAQEKHLERMIKKIAPKTLKRDYLGVVVPEKTPNQEPMFASLESQLVLLGVNPSTPHIETRTMLIAKTLWLGVNVVSGLNRQTKELLKYYSPV